MSSIDKTHYVHCPQGGVARALFDDSQGPPVDAECICDEQDRLYELMLKVEAERLKKEPGTMCIYNMNPNAAWVAKAKLDGIG